MPVESELVYISNTRIPSRKANTYQSFCVCEAFADFFEKVSFWHPRRWNPDGGLCADPFAFYNVERRFTLVELEALDNRLFATRFHLGYAATNTLFGLVAAMRLLLDGKQKTVFVRDVGTLKAIGSFRRLGLLRHHRVIFEEHVFAPGHLPYLAMLDGLVTINRHLENLYRERLDIPILTAHDGVRLTEYGEKCPRPPGPPQVLYLGNFFRWKGVHTLAQAAQQFGDEVIFRFVGGSQEPDPEFQSTISRRQNVRVEGFVGRVEALERLRQASVLVLPNSGLDTMSTYTSPLKLFEYMAAGRPIVASRLPSLMEILHDGENAILCNPDDPADLAAKIRFVLKNDCSHLTRRAWQDVQEYGWGNRARNICAWMNFLEAG
ncbi:glycosyltransferase family 4 protein [Geomonas subterranea]|uniref:Glycosyltransferase family 4 protein n=1 Tax=Geomonas subterranea TaxID=2847989 RepID=A0ABX8LL10_9BACT|nr:glycosyltransferase family 4 protein [Geomonas subterranea]QXE91557.1 glycosyltransferase family 4 protein [Geomonas subterranea]